MSLSGVLVIDKPSGPTSHDVVSRVRRAIGESRVGHTGTLDPLATGVLALLIGRATRLAQFLSSDDKEYLATVRLGMSTPTYDAEGIDADADVGLKPEAADRAETGSFRLQPDVGVGEIEKALDTFRGTYLQMPPPFSAKKVAGVRAYQHARKQQVVELTAVEVTVSALEVVRVERGLLQLRLVCTSGFYVRTLAHELGQRLGCGAYLESLRRTRAGDFSLEQAVALDAVQADPGRAAARLVPSANLLPGFPRIVLNEAGVRRVQHGNSVGPEHFGEIPNFAGFPAKFRLFGPSGALLAVADSQPGGLLHPAVVLV